MQKRALGSVVVSLAVLGLWGCSGDFTSYPLFNSVLPDAGSISQDSPRDAGLVPDAGAVADAGTREMDAGTQPVGCAGGAPSTTVAPATVDVSCFTSTFDDEFNAYDISSGPFDDGQHANEKWFNGTDQCCMAPTDAANGGVMYPTPGAVTGQPVNPYSLLPGGGLQVRLSKSNDEWFGGVMTSVDGNENGFSQMYGYFEIDTQLAPGEGTFPSFWMLSLPRSEPGGEIDVFEQLGCSGIDTALTQRIFHTTLHDWRPDGVAPGFWAWDDDPNDPATSAYYSETPDLTTGYHRYGLLWNASYTAVYFDGKLYHSFPTPAVMVGRKYFLLVDNGVGGGGWDTHHTGNPSDMKVQSVRAYDVPGF